jgi:cold shock CspA family protein
MTMRTHGTLVKWSDDRGFGFVALPKTHEELFVHISAFPRDGVRPRIGETISFEVGSGPDGRKRAERVERPASRLSPRPTHHAPATKKHSLLSAVISTAIVGALGFYGYNTYTSRRDVSREASFAAPQSVESGNQQFSCDGRTHCSQMTSCAEATYFLKHCPNAQMDGKNDGEPCEQQWCN